MSRAIISVRDDTFEVLRKEKLILGSKNAKRRYTWDDFFRDLLKK